jgi:hypothetical protein
LLCCSIIVPDLACHRPPPPHHAAAVVVVVIIIIVLAIAILIAVTIPSPIRVPFDCCVAASGRSATRRWKNNKIIK